MFNNATPLSVHDNLSILSDFVSIPLNSGFGTKPTISSALLYRINSLDHKNCDPTPLLTILDPSYMSNLLHATILGFDECWLRLWVEPIISINPK